MGEFGSCEIDCLQGHTACPQCVWPRELLKSSDREEDLGSVENRLLEGVPP